MSWIIEGYGLTQPCMIRGDERLEPMLTQFCPDSGRIFVLMEERVAALHGDKIPPWYNRRLLLPSLGEGLKQSCWLEYLLTFFYRLRVARGDWIVAVGGGALLDLVGFAASIYKRGVNTVYVPTTLLAQVDAALGGKTAINWRGVKNLVGSFAFPVRVFCAADVLNTLSRRQFIAGLGEVNKYQILMGRFQIQPRNKLDSRVVEECCRYKDSLIAQDPFDCGQRRVLNLGHTLAHALEAVDSTMLHGEAVAWGLEYALLVARGRGAISQYQLERWARMVRTLPRPRLPGVDFNCLYETMLMDKKNTDGVQMVLPQGKGFELTACTRKELEKNWLALKENI